MKFFGFQGQSEDDDDSLLIWWMKIQKWKARALDMIMWDEFGRN